MFDDIPTQSVFNKNVIPKSIIEQIAYEVFIHEVL